LDFNTLRAGDADLRF